ncbi:MAG: galactokinase, partial [Eggerthellaceae bacterium]|nr:galactokinase [Eggerthellaceae bacterium]
FYETKRVKALTQALKANDFETFLANARTTGSSSAQNLQNVTPKDDNDGHDQPVMMILGLCTHLLKNRGAARIHGGGFGGSVLAFVPLEEKESFVSFMNSSLGYEACQELQPGAKGAWAVKIG